MESKLPFEKINREILVKKEAKTNCTLKEIKAEELINYGIVNIDKPAGPTSHQVSDYVQKILGISKAGHSGTLDPGVTGVLPIALGRATRIVQNLLTAGKEYVALMHLHKKVDEEKLRKALNEFVGKIRQKPPLKSAVKRVEREREIYYLDILEVNGQDVLFRIGCQAGTYIRKYIHDFGQRIGCGAHMAELRRTRVAAFDETTLATLQDLADAFYYYKQEDNDKFIRKIIQPIENAVRHLPKIWVLDTTIGSLCHGVDLKIPGISKIETNINEEETVAVMTLNNELIAIGTTKMDSYDIMEKEKGIAVKIEKVFMVPETYTKT